MALLIASDIHGSALWCERLMEAIEREEPSRVILLGDLLYHGPRNDLPEGYGPKYVIAMLNSIKDSLFCVRGNCEAEVDQMVLEFPCMADYGQIIDSDGRLLHCTHGHIWNPEKLPPLPAGSAFLYGHTHVKVLEELEDSGITVFNPGSVALPKDGSHSYGIYENGQFRHEILR